MKKEKIIKATNVGELLHHYANSTFDKDKLKDYSYEGDFFYIGGSIYAKIISKKKKIVLIQPFDRCGGWGNGYNSTSLERCFSDEWTILKYERLVHLPDKLEDYTKNDFLRIALYNLKESVLNKVNNYVTDKYIINTPTAFARINIWNHSKDFEYILKVYVSKFKVSKSIILKHIYNEVHYTTVAYNGWSTARQEKYKIDKPISFYLDSTKWHTEKERNILDFKAWKYKYFNSNIKTYKHGKTYKQIYDDINLKAIFEKEHERLLIIHNSNVIKEREKQEAKELIVNKDKLELWSKGDNVNILYNIPIHLRIKNERIETTRGDIIPFESGKKLFALFNKIRQDNNIIIYDAQPDEVIVGNYRFRNIEYLNEHWYVTVGCHKLRDTEIDLFINNNNLQDWL